MTVQELANAADELSNGLDYLAGLAHEAGDSEGEARCHAQAATLREVRDLCNTVAAGQ